MSASRRPGGAILSTRMAKDRSLTDGASAIGPSSGEDAVVRPIEATISLV
jgi:hypothetical protein